MNFQTPILFFIFNRPNTTAQVFEEIRKLKPAKLYIVADGPRKNKTGEHKRCEETRKIIEQVDWDCCLPDQSFFRFCEEMLEKYKYEEKIGMISGNNFQFNKVKNDYSYYFSRYAHIWGWATWKRTWDKYNVQISDWPQIKKEKRLTNIFKNAKDVMYWTSIFEDVYNDKIDTWDYQWSYVCFVNNLLSIMPSNNLVSNIGFNDKDSTHTKRISKFSNMKTSPLLFPLNHPLNIVNNIKSDKITQKNNYPFFRRFMIKLLRKIKIL